MGVLVHFVRIFPATSTSRLLRRPSLKSPWASTESLRADFRLVLLIGFSKPHFRRIRNLIPPLRSRGTIGSALVGHPHLIKHDVWGSELEGHIVVCGVCRERGFQAPGSSDH